MEVNGRKGAHVWFWRANMPERKGSRCHVIPVYRLDPSR
jgi:hypothetical protein